jgi:hypothetical protein
MAVSRSTGARLSLEEAVYRNGAVPGDYDVRSELDALMARLAGRPAPGRPVRKPGRAPSAFPVDLRVHDDVALGEIELYAEVLAAVAGSDRPLSPAQLDEVLGVTRDTP